MATIASNKILPIAVASIFAVLVAVVYKSVSKNELSAVTYSGDLAKAPVPQSVDVDSTADTIRSLKGQMELLQEANAEKTRVNDKLIETNTALVEDREKITDELALTVQNEIALQSATSEGNSSFLLEQMQQLSEGVNQFKSEIESRVDAVEVPEVPVGLGLSGPQYRSGQLINAIEVTDIVWILPLDEPPVVAGEGTKRSGLSRVASAVDIPGRLSANSNSSRSANSSLAVADDSNSNQVSSRNTVLGNSSIFSGRGGRAGNDVVTSNQYSGSYYTLPDLSVLANSTTLTALVGKVYITDNITNPYPFKVIVGRDNITANNQKLPSNIESMIFEGFATGDWPLSCVRGTLTAATFVFDNGSVKSAYVGDPGSRPDDGPFDPNAIGYISDEWGNPCVQGEPITNAPRFLAQSILLAGAEGYASALRAQEIDTVTSVDSDGTQSTSETLTGDAKDAGIASAYLGGIEETSSWLKERQRQSFDAIYIRSGQRIAINLQQELRLDISADARLLEYKSRSTRSAKID